MSDRLQQLPYLTPYFKLHCISKVIYNAKSLFYTIVVDNLTPSKQSSAHPSLPLSLSHTHTHVSPSHIISLPLLLANPPYCTLAEFWSGASLGNTASVTESPES